MIVVALIVLALSGQTLTQAPDIKEFEAELLDLTLLTLRWQDDNAKLAKKVDRLEKRLLAIKEESALLASSASKQDREALNARLAEVISLGQEVEKASKKNAELNKLGLELRRRLEQVKQKLSILGPRRIARWGFLFIKI